MGYIIKFEDLDKLDRSFKQLLGRKNRLMRMIEKRNELLKPILLEEFKLTKEIDNLKKELKEINDKVLEVSQEKKWDPNIVIVKCKVKGNPYYKGKVRFRKDKRKEKVKMIPKKIELKIWKKVQDDNPNDTNEQLEGVFKGRLRNWVMDWWRKEGILEKK
jgi:hypothetical protein